MGHRWKFAAIGLLALAALYVGAVWLIGLRVQSQLLRSEQQLLGAHGYLVPVRRDYRRGLFGASERVTWRLAAPRRTLAGLDAASGRSLQVTLYSRIQLGPLPQEGALALARIDSALYAGTPRTEPPRDEALLQARTGLDWRAGVHAQLLSPPRSYRLSEERALHWGGLSGQLALTDAQRHLQLTLHTAGVALSGPEGQLQLGDLAVQTDVQRLFEVLWVGRTSVHVQSLQLMTSSGQAVDLQGLGMQNVSSASGDYIDQSAELAADSLQVGTVALHGLAYDQSFTHLYAPSLAALVGALGRLPQQAGAGALEPAQLMALLRRYGTTLALHEPVLTLSRLSFSMPDGRFSFSGQLSVQGLPQTAALAALASHLRITADLNVDASLATTLLSGNARSAVYLGELQQLLQQGYVHQQGGAYQCHLSYLGGWLSINDRPFPPQPAASSP